MIIAIDVHYRENIAKTVSIEFENWTNEEPTKIHILELPKTAEYVPGQFYKRELPCILEVLKLSNLNDADLIIIDGHVVLDDNGKMGLGAYLYKELNENIPILGVAKKGFHSLEKLAIPIRRGESKKPLYLTCMGADLNDLANKVKQMHGDFRIPTLLKILDVETKK